MPNPAITKPNTVEAFMKAHATLRVGVDAVDALIVQLNLLSADIVKAAEANAIKAARTTILAADITAAMPTITGSTSDLPFLFKQLENLTAKDTATLSALIQTWLDTH